VSTVEDLPQRDESYYKYELAGILVHTGTADYGHYYSFIRERLPKVAGEACKWYQFNDTLVEPFDPEEIPKTCFGGADTVTEWDEVAGKHVPKWRAKTYNAYMLFYQRVKVNTHTLHTTHGIRSGAHTRLASSSAQPIHPVRVLEERQAAQLVPEPIYNGIWEENMAFFQDKNIFDPDYFDFLWSVVKLDQSAPVTGTPQHCNSTNFSIFK
jgi:ubiquitin carboxyl-terminal hydrolase 34